MIDSERARLICAGVARHQAAFYLMHHKTLFGIDAISAEVGGVALVRGADLIIRAPRIIARCARLVRNAIPPPIPTQPAKCRSSITVTISPCFEPCQDGMERALMVLLFRPEARISFPIVIRFGPERALNRSIIRELTKTSLSRVKTIPRVRFIPPKANPSKSFATFVKPLCAALQCVHRLVC